MKGLFKMNVDFRRMGNLEGVFIADSDDVDYLVNKKICVYFGEVLGKHSEIYGNIKKNDIKLISTDNKVINVIEEYELENGYNPFNYSVFVQEMENIPENGIEWNDCTVSEFIDFQRNGDIPKYQKENYLNYIKLHTIK